MDIWTPPPKEAKIVAYPPDTCGRGGCKAQIFAYDGNRVDMWEGSVSGTWANLQITYAQLERALVEIYSVDEASISKLRARYKHFQKLGLPSRRPGTGNRVKFDMNEFCQILLAMELSEFGLDPMLIKAICVGFIYDFGDGMSVLGELSREMIFNITPPWDHNAVPVEDHPSFEMKYLIFEARAMSYRWQKSIKEQNSLPVTFPHKIVAGDELAASLLHKSSASVINLTKLGKRAYEQLNKYVVYGECLYEKER